VKWAGTIFAARRRARDPCKCMLITYPVGRVLYHVVSRTCRFAPMEPAHACDHWIDLGSMDGTRKPHSQDIWIEHLSGRLPEMSDFVHSAKHEFVTVNIEETKRSTLPETLQITLSIFSFVPNLGFILTSFGFNLTTYRSSHNVTQSHKHRKQRN
jgi:hypothetical protein